MAHVFVGSGFHALLSFTQVGSSSSSGKPKEYRERTIQSHRILIVEFSDALAQTWFRHSGDFVDHES
jgi:hypothetical protein